MSRFTGLLRNWFVLSVLLTAACITHAQFALSSGTYTQDFNTIGSGLPSNWTVRTGATATALGTAVSPVTTAVSWANTSGQWQNSASATGMTGGEAVAVQAAAANRALAIRQSGTFGDPGASANFNFSTIGQQVSAISFTAQMLSVQTRSTVWLLQYGIGATPATWTTIATFTDPGAFGSTTVTASGFGTALDNQPNAWLRIVTLAATTGAGSRDTFGIDDFSITTIVGGGPIAPSIGTSPSSQTVTEGAASVQFHVVASGDAPLSYQWRKGGSALTNDAHFSGVQTDTLTISNVVLGDNGNYDVVVSNGVPPDAASTTATLTVNPVIIPPTIATQPTPQSAPPGGSATFTVAANGTAPLTYHWRKNGSPLSDGGNISGSATTSLTINPVSAADVGSYDVVVSNGALPDATSSGVGLSLAAIVTPSGQISYVGGSYIQNFDTLPASGTFTLTSNGPLSFTAAPISAAGLGGWSFAKYDGTGTVALFRVDAGTSTSGSIYSYGSAASTDRALGSLSSGTTVPRFGVVLTNSTGLPITQFTLNYRGEQWRRGTASANKLTFEYSTDATDVNTGTFTAAPALDFTAPVTTGSGTALVGNNAPNFATVTGTVSGLTWLPGQTLFLRWTDVDDTGGDDGLAIDDLNLSTPVGTGDILPSVVYTTPAAGAVNIALNPSFSVTFNEAVNFSTASVTLSGSASGLHTVTVSGGPGTYTVTPDVPFGEIENVSLTVLAAQVTDAATGTVHPGADYTASYITTSSGPLPIHVVQGSGSASAYKGYEVTVQGIVTAVFQGVDSLNGYYIEAPDASQDANPATSEGIFVFDSTHAPAVGDLVTITGTVDEFGAVPNSQTEIKSVTGFTVVSSGNLLPTPVAVSLPFPAPGYAERYEGMLVTFPQALTVTDNYDLGAFGELMLSNGRLSTPTNIVAPGAAAQAQEAANLLNQVLLDDGSSKVNPSPTPYLNSSDPALATRRTGSTAAGVTGIFDNKFGAYVVEPTVAPTFVEANPRANSPASLGSLRVAIGNVENFMNGDGAGSGFPTSRGPSTFAEYQRQLDKVTAAILNVAPDIMGLTEVENDRVSNGAADSYGATSMIAQLVANLNAHAPAGTTYAFVNAAPVDIVTDVIHCALIYRVETVEEAGVAAMLNSAAFNNVARNPLAQTFRQKSTGAKLTVCINHFRAKGGPAPGDGNLDSGDGQGTNNALRVQEADAVTSWLAGFPTGDNDPDILIIGDLNSYAKEDPITHIVNAGYVNLSERFEGEGGYSYAFNGEFGHLDHALASPSLNAQVLSTATWHANSDEPVYYDYNVEGKQPEQLPINAGTPYRYADHDPVVIGVDLTTPPAIVTQPISQTVTVGTSVTFTVVASGNPAPTFQWRKGGNPIGGATGASYTIASPVVADGGDYDVVATNSVDSATSNVATLTVNQGVADVALSDLSHVYDGAAHAASVSTTPAGLTVHVTYNGSSTAPTNAGSYTVAAAVDDVNYTGSASGTLTITQAGAGVSLGNLTQVFDGSPKPVTVSTTPNGLIVGITYNGSATAPTNVGTYSVVATVTEDNYTGSASGTLSITAASSPVSLESLVQNYDGTPKSVTVVTDPAGLSNSVTYNGSATPPTYPGAYAVVATITDANYTGTASDTLFITTGALVRHGPTVNGILDGSIQVLLAESTTLNSSAQITGDLLLPGTPTVKINGSPVYGGTIDSNGVATPNNYTVTLNSGAKLRHVVRRVNAIAMPTVSAPPAPTGTRNVTLNSAGQSAGDFATLRNLTLNSNAGAVVVPAGTYGAFTANGTSSLVLGVVGATTPAVYNLQNLTLNSSSRITLVGPVVINLANGVTFNGSVGQPGMPDWLELNVASGNVGFNGAITFDGFMLVPNGTVTINGGVVVNGGVTADKLTINSGGRLNQQ